MVGDDTFGQRLRQLRINAGKSQTEVSKEMRAMFGEHIHMGQTNVSALELRKTAPREKVLVMLCAYFRVRPTFFLDRRPEDKMMVARQWINMLRRIPPGYTLMTVDPSWITSFSKTHEHHDTIDDEWLDT